MGEQPDLDEIISLVIKLLGPDGVAFHVDVKFLEYQLADRITEVDLGLVIVLPDADYDHVSVFVHGGRDSLACFRGICTSPLIMWHSWMLHLHEISWWQE